MKRAPLTEDQMLDEIRVAAAQFFALVDAASARLRAVETALQQVRVPMRAAEASELGFIRFPRDDGLRLALGDRMATDLSAEERVLAAAKLPAFIKRYHAHVMGLARGGA